MVSSPHSVDDTAQTNSVIAAVVAPAIVQSAAVQTAAKVSGPADAEQVLVDIVETAPVTKQADVPGIDAPVTAVAAAVADTPAPVQDLLGASVDSNTITTDKSLPVADEDSAGGAHPGAAAPLHQLPANGTADTVTPDLAADVDSTAEPAIEVTAVAATADAAADKEEEEMLAGAGAMDAHPGSSSAPAATATRGRGRGKGRQGGGGRPGKNKSGKRK